MKFTKSLLLAAAAVVMPLASQAASITSNPLINVGPMTFSNFSCQVSLAGVLATPSDCSQVNVSAINATPGGISFQSGFTAAYNSLDDVKLGYSLNLAPGSTVSSVNLTFDGSIFGQAIAEVTESVFSNSIKIGQLVVNCNSTSCNNYQSTLNLGGSYSNLTIEKDINVSAAANSTATTSIIDQTFSPVSSPEPASTALMGAGLALSAFALRRKLSANN